MEFYFHFIGTLAFGLFGLGVVMKFVLEVVFSDWDAFADFKAWIIRVYNGHGLLQTARTEDILLEAERARLTPLSTRLIDARREQLKEIDLVETELSRPKASASKYDEAWK